MKKKITSNQILGGLVGICAVFFLFAEKNILFHTQILSGQVNSGVLDLVTGLLSLLFFFLIVRRFTKNKNHGLVRYFLSSLVLSFSASLGFIMVITQITGTPAVGHAIMNGLENEGTRILLNNLVLLFLIAILSVFVACLVLVLKPKVNYIKEISGELEKMEKEGFGREIRVRGDDELAHLSKRINSMSATIKEKQEREKEEEQQKNRLIADISHDLRTPLTSILGYVDLLKEEGFSNPEKSKQYLEVVDRRLNNLKLMIDQLFEFTKLNQSDFCLERQDTDLALLLKYIDFEYGTIFQRTGRKWCLKVDQKELPVNLDVGKFMQAMENLLENARKYSNPDSEIVLSAKREGALIHLCLSNETTKIREEDLERLFERFYKTDEARTSSASTGLGLPIVKKIMELHGGKVSARLSGNRIFFDVLLEAAEENHEANI